MLERSGFHLLLYEAEARFEQPCRSLRLEVHHLRRPAIAVPELPLRAAAQIDSGEVSDGEARALVAAAIELHDRVRPAIEALVGSTKTHSLAVLVRKMEDALDAMDPDVRLSTQAGLELDSAALLTLSVGPLRTTRRLPGAGGCKELTVAPGEGRSCRSCTHNVDQQVLWYARR